MLDALAFTTSSSRAPLTDLSDRVNKHAVIFFAVSMLFNRFSFVFIYLCVCNGSGRSGSLTRLLIAHFLVLATFNYPLLMDIKY